MKNLRKATDDMNSNITEMRILMCLLNDTAQKMKFPIDDFFCKYDQISSFLRIWSHLLKKSLMKTSFFAWCEEDGETITLGYRHSFYR